MIITDTFYAIKCNRCGDLHNDGEYEFYIDEDSAYESASNSDWLHHNNSDYCTCCYDCETLKPYPEFPKHIKEFRKVFDSLSRSRSDIIDMGSSVWIKASIWGGFSKEKEECVKLLLGDKLIEFIRDSGRWTTDHIKIHIEK